MKIVYLVCGSGDVYYCENCVRDGTLIHGLLQAGHDVEAVPLYLPPNLDMPQLQTDTPVFFGGINVYLQQKMQLFQRTPRWIDRMFDSHWLLAMAGRRTGMTDPDLLATTTLSMLAGEDGRQAKELYRLINWLETRERPDVVILSNALLVGMAPTLKERLKVPVLCLLQDEDEFVDELEQADQDACWTAMRLAGQAVDCYVAVSDFFARKMKALLQLPDERLRVIYPGVGPEAFPEVIGPLPPPTIGYLSRLMNNDQGIELLAQVFIEIRRQLDQDVRLLLAGGPGPGNGIPKEGGLARLAQAGYGDSVTFTPGFDRSARSRFYSELTVLAVPEQRDPAFRLYTLEALAHGVPLVGPDRGFFGELAGMVRDGVTLWTDDSVQNLAELLVPLLRDTGLARQKGLAGRAVVKETFTARRAADALASLITELR
jgi:glycosyltransferase involved in cell wall biosynthesis